MSNWSIVTKIVAAACGIVCTLVLLGGFVLIKFEIKMVTTFTRQILTELNEFIDDRASQAKTKFITSMFPTKEASSLNLLIIGIKGYLTGGCIVNIPCLLPPPGGIPASP